MRVCIANREAANLGFTLDRWLVLPTTSTELARAMKDIRAKSTGEVVLSMWEDDDTGLVHEDCDIFKLNEQARILKGFSDFDTARLFYLIQHKKCTLSSALELFDSVVYYEGMGLTEVAILYLASGVMGDFNAYLADYIDADAYGFYLKSLGYLETDDGVFYYP
jgi:hypothetical protein